MTVKIYVEGGGDTKALKTKCREGFHKLIEKSGIEGRMPRISAKGSRFVAYDSFRTAMMQKSDQEYPILLVDSEGPVEDDNAWTHLLKRDGWQKPEGAQDDQAQLMVQCMETWCVADKETLKKFYGQKLLAGSLPETDLENRSKGEIQDALKHATHPCGSKKCYRKGEHSFELLAQLNPDVLKELPHFKKLCDDLNSVMSK